MPGVLKKTSSPRRERKKSPLRLLSSTKISCFVFLHPHFLLETKNCSLEFFSEAEVCRGFWERPLPWRNLLRACEPPRDRLDVLHSCLVRFASLLSPFFERTSFSRRKLLASLLFPFRFPPPSPSLLRFSSDSFLVLLGLVGLSSSALFRVPRSLLESSRETLPLSLPLLSFCHSRKFPSCTSLSARRKFFNQQTRTLISLSSAETFSTSCADSNSPQLSVRLAPGSFQREKHLPFSCICFEALSLLLNIFLLLSSSFSPASSRQPLSLSVLFLFSFFSLLSPSLLVCFSAKTPLPFTRDERESFLSPPILLLLLSG